MTVELIAFVRNAAREQGLPYAVEETDSGFALALDLQAQDYLETNSVPEAFLVTVRLSEVKGSPAYGLDEAVFLLKKTPEGFELGEELELRTSQGHSESESIDTADWKLHRASRWVSSILEFKGYTRRGGSVARNRTGILVAAAVGLLVLLGAAFAGVSAQMGEGSDLTTQVVDSTDDDRPSDEVVDGFFG